MAAALEASQPLFHAAQLSLTATGAAPRRGKQALIVPKEWSEQTSRSAFHLRQVSVMFALHKRPCSSDPRVRRGEQSGHTSSISGDHRGCCAAWSREPSGWMDWNSSGCGCSGSAEGWQQLLCADVKPPPNPPIVTAACESPSPNLSQTSSGQIYGTTTLLSPFSLPELWHAGPPLHFFPVSPFLCPVTFRRLVIRQQRSGMRKTHTTE